jgi:hypothetical protein
MFFLFFSERKKIFTREKKEYSYETTDKENEYRRQTKQTTETKSLSTDKENK